MDDPALPEAELLAALDGLARLNMVSRAASVLVPPLRAAAAATPSPLRVLDVASGGGEVAIDACAALKRRGVDVHLTLSDINARSLERAAAYARKKTVPASAVVVDVLAPSGLRGHASAQYDVVMCSLFAHHLDGPDVVRLLREMGAASRRLVLVSDLARGVLNRVMINAAARVLTRSPVVHFDSDASAMAAWTPRELAAMAAEAGLTDIRVSRRFPARMLLTASPSKVPA